jgi:uncharacterized protein (DUF2062 family)
MSPTDVTVLERIDTPHAPRPGRMIRRRVSQVHGRVRDRLVAAFVEEYTPREVSVSFSLGVFITALPSLGTGVLAFFVLAFLFDRLSKIALFASVIVLNPVVKWGVYAASYSLGRLLLGPVPGVSFGSVSPSLSLGEAVLARLLLGNLILATAFAVVAYFAGLRIVTAIRRRAQDEGVHVLDLSTDAGSAEE